MHVLRPSFGSVSHAAAGPICTFEIAGSTPPEQACWNDMASARLESATPGSECRCVIHWARLKLVFSISRLLYCCWFAWKRCCGSCSGDTPFHKHKYDMAAWSVLYHGFSQMKTKRSLNRRPNFKITTEFV